MIKIVLIALTALIAGVLVLASMRPGSFRVERSLRIHASPDRILPLINDFHQWGVWSPYEKLDPSMRRTYAGSASGQGAVYEWDGNGKAGKGRMQIIDAQPTRTVIQLDFSRPFTAHNIAEFNARPGNDGTELTWSMDGPSPFISKVMGLFFNMDRMIGTDFETGLANLKSVSEK